MGDKVGDNLNYQVGDYVLYLGVYLFQCVSINDGIYGFELKVKDGDKISNLINYFSVTKFNYEGYCLLRLPNNIDISQFEYASEFNLKLYDIVDTSYECRGLDCKPGDFICCYDNFKNKLLYGFLYSSLSCFTIYGIIDMYYGYVKVDWDFDNKDEIRAFLLKYCHKNFELSLKNIIEPGMLFLYNKKIYLYLGKGRYIKHIGKYKVADFMDTHMYLAYPSKDIIGLLNRLDNSLFSKKVLSKRIKDDLFLTFFRHDPYPQLEISEKVYEPELIYNQYDLSFLGKEIYFLNKYDNGYEIKSKEEVKSVSECKEYIDIILDEN